MRERARHALTYSVLLLSLPVLVGAEVPQSRSPERGDTIEVSVTAYCIKGETKSGVQTRRGIVAADPDVLPLGTIIRISGLDGHNGRYSVQDTGRAIKGNDVDIFMPDCNAAERFGRQEGRARVIRLGEPDEPRPKRRLLLANPDRPHQQGVSIASSFQVTTTCRAR